MPKIDFIYMQLEKKEYTGSMMYKREQIRERSIMGRMC
jgi:hypothetical protein